MLDENRCKVAIYKDGDYDAQCQKLVDKLEWKRIYEHVNPNYYHGKHGQQMLHGLVQVFRKKEALTKDEAFRRIMQVRREVKKKEMKIERNKKERKEELERKEEKKKERR